MANNSLKRTHQKKGNGGNVKVRYREGNPVAIGNLANSVSKVYNTTKKLLHPLKVPNVEVFLIKLSDKPSNYRITSNRRNRYYPLVIYYSDETEIDLGCERYSQICDEVFAVLPHELTHIALAELIDPNDDIIRWFDEGVAKYVETIISKKHARSVFDRDYWNTFPEVSLSRKEIREALWNWKIPDEEEKSGCLPSWKARWNTMSLYGASGQLIRELVENRTKTPGHTSLNTILEELQASKGRGLLTSEKILAQLGRKFDLNLKALGQLSAESKTKFTADAERILNEMANNGTAVENRPRVYWALSVLACLDNELSKQAIGSTIEILLDNKHPAIIHHLSATTLFKRANSNAQQRDIIYTELKEKDISIAEFDSLLVKMSF
ncbi:hypothetical protein [Leptolyngbya sp. 7M]|uniref:hypothetical protein n=1 Tax=Leptolyngbya sp. 7M TaxID=2812896 RepID=UPI001B8C9A45|nr:hypothetical protein [Leptolyngbya sp. 7M]QYO67110.1 hypothetical protein JVX88_10040 [Leptolyngbya sp. 7M]